jgi:hypothetical protein
MLTVSGLAFSGATRRARRRYPPGLTLFARGARFGRHTRNRAKCHRAQDHQRPRPHILQAYIAPAEQSGAATAPATV